MHRSLTLAACGEQFRRSCTRVRTTRLQDVSVAKDCAKNVGHLDHSRSTVEPDPTQEGKGETMYATTNGRRPAAGAAATRSRFLRVSCLAVLGGTGLLAGASRRRGRLRSRGFGSAGARLAACSPTRATCSFPKPASPTFPRPDGSPSSAQTERAGPCLTGCPRAPTRREATHPGQTGLPCAAAPFTSLSGRATR